MNTQKINRIERAIRHIQTAANIDPWAVEIAVDAMKKQIPEKPMVNIDACNKSFWYLYCPTCGLKVGVYNKRLKSAVMFNDTNSKICAQCGQMFNLKLQDGE